MKGYCTYFLLFFFGLSQNVNLFAQEVSEFQSVIGQISELENKKDPKCHATASRLEDFIYGTPLSFEARSKRIAFQKAYVKTLWLDFTRQKNKQKADEDDLALFKKIEKKYFEYSLNQKGIQLVFLNKHQLLIPERDYRQYSSIAYALRAILSVQQANIFESESLASLDKAVMTYFKKSVDLAVLALLQEADQLARMDNQFQIGATHIDQATKKLFNDLKPITTKISSQQTVDQKALLYEIIDQKQRAYQAYNQINQSVFLRNIQVYFAKVLWPTDPNQSRELTNFYTEFMVQYSADLLAYAEAKALQQNKSTIEYEDIYEAVQAYLPHTINQFEDVTYFPNLDRNEQIVIEAYDLDAFRDSGLHWQYLKYALDDRKSALHVAPDPFALELLVEGVAQFAVVVFRMAGANAKENKAEQMEKQHLTNALMAFQQKINTDQNSQKTDNGSSIISERTTKKENTGALFSEITGAYDLDFQHRNSDWLGRAIRGYVLNEEEGVARLSIPPAFGGGGVAAEDIDNDGWVDVLLLGGRGNRLYRNDNGKKLEDITAKSGIDWKRPDGNYGEPRQPIILDFDNDGWQDIFISYANDTHRIYRNRGDGTFEDMTLQADLGGTEEVAGPATSIDYNKDGLPDLYIGYFGNYVKGELPTLKRHNTNGGKNRLFRNLGNFKFEEVSEGSGLQNAGWTQAVGHSDINGDGWQDLIVGNDFGVNAYYINNQDGTFTDFSKDMGTDKPSYTMNIGISDLNQDMRPDFYISNIVIMEKDDKYVLPNEDTKAHFDPASLASMRVVEANDLFISKNDGKGGVSFSKSTAIGRGFSATGWSWDADFFDFDNDGDDDLYCLTGMNQYSVYGKTNEYYSSPEGESKDVTYANSNAKEANVLFENTNGVLEVHSNSGGLDFSGTSRSAAFFDLDNDGDQDIIVNDYQGKARLFRNHAEQQANNWIAIKLEGDPTQGMTKDAIGASITLQTSNGKKRWKEVYSTTGYLSVHPKLIHFGLGENSSCDIEIRWPNGHVQKVQNLSSNTFHNIDYIK